MSAVKSSTWGSRLGFILATVGSAVGLGAIWKFPYMAGTYGGAVFLIPYIGFSITIGAALLLAEFAMGRAGRAGPMESLTKVIGKGWGFFGGLGVLTVFIILSFYSVVGGWCVKYLVDAIQGEGLIENTAQLGEYFGSFVSNSQASFVYLVIFLLLTALVVLRGVQSGIERVAKILMPLLFLLMLVLIIRGLTLPGGMNGVDFLFTPKWEAFNASALFNAMGFTFFSLSLGAGTMITYGSYLNPQANLTSSCAWIVFLGILSSLLGGLMIMPSVFAFGVDPTAGPGLTFVTMPAIFAQMPMGHGLAVIFYICLVVAALTSSMSMLEACCALLMRQFNWSRVKSIVITVSGALGVGTLSMLSFGPWSDVTLFGKTIFDILDYVTSNIGMPLSTFGIAIGASWFAWSTTRLELQTTRPLSEGTLFFIRIMMGVISPLFVVAVALGNL